MSKYCWKQIFSLGSSPKVGKKKKIKKRRAKVGNNTGQLTRCPGYGFILVRVSYLLFVICYLLFVIICYLLFVIFYGGKVKSTNLSWVRVGLGWVGV